jgi:PPM family protein phosphatase
MFLKWHKPFIMRPFPIVTFSMFEIGHISHSGKKRLLNEDTYDLNPVSGLLVVVDGMGGQDAGDIASAFVRDHVHHTLQQGDSPAEALRSAGQALRIQRLQPGSPSGASAIAGRFQEDTLHLAWVGTCSALFSDGLHYRNIHPKSHTPDTGKSAAGSVIQALGVTTSDALCIHEATMTLKRGESVLLCTDGMLEACTTAVLETSLCDPRLSAQESVELLLMHALRGEASNNLTALRLCRS